MQKNCNVHFTKSGRMPNEQYFLDPDSGHQKGKSSVLRGWSCGKRGGWGGWVLNLCAPTETGSREKPQEPIVVAHARVSAFSRLRQEDCCKFQSSLGYKVRMALLKRAETGSHSTAQASLDLLGSSTAPTPASRESDTSFTAMLGSCRTGGGGQFPEESYGGRRGGPQLSVSEGVAQAPTRTKRSGKGAVTDCRGLTAQGPPAFSACPSPCHFQVDPQPSSPPRDAGS